MTAISKKFMVQVLANIVEKDVLDKATAVMDKVGASAQLDYGVKEGWYKVSTVQLNGEAIGVIWHNLSPHKVLFIQGIAAIDRSDKHMAAFSVAIDKLAGLYNIKIVEMKAVRVGMVNEAIKYGFKPDSVCMRKHYV